MLRSSAHAYFEYISIKLFFWGLDFLRWKFHVACIDTFLSFQAGRSVV